MLALVAVRKLMDKIFTKYELEVLDDVMPESIKKKIEEDDDMEEDSLVSCGSRENDTNNINQLQKLRI